MNSKLNSAMYSAHMIMRHAFGYNDYNNKYGRINDVYNKMADGKRLRLEEREVKSLRGLVCTLKMMIKNTDIITYDEECCICMAKNNRKEALPCQHNVCRDCYYKPMRNNCPVCNMEWPMRKDDKHAAPYGLAEYAHTYGGEEQRTPSPPVLGTVEGGDISPRLVGAIRTNDTWLSSRRDSPYHIENRIHNNNNNNYDENNPDDLPVIHPPRRRHRQTAHISI
ncbi:ORF118 [Ostreid herpesvirus 1]|uniref:Putative RING finger protein ORF118 n=2 Tax=Ostreid herpesvirus 1 TaxID=261939 RepID=Y118_OSHVF|nr:ORF118 [Ostreid herpesvirus 1]YP_024671.1 ORF118 [Ostreid herpesvirus 1]Q6R797.1 RecName: Full=Putative RING finger protein ORF118 [Ostreid herpesvirus 1 (isolate France)]AAS01007.1 ORF118 [Ostreid herpesvirus 1]AAS01018.1 ORF118 [Ostreid herpesvirus 1]AHC31186.1 hypothetical protein [Ostreid herpesvirus 1]AHC31187.1 hypothetical protein [Ostreid herpesvirus 1]AHC31188.1 hypothetical protein [Ostreid herpesvirus 1]